MAPREVTAVALAAARLRITIDAGFAVAIMDAVSGTRLAAARDPSHKPNDSARPGLTLGSGPAPDPSEAAWRGGRVPPGVTPRVTLGTPRGAGSCRNWIVCLWALERAQPRGDGQGLLGTWQGRAWLSAISQAILRQLSRAPSTEGKVQPRAAHQREDVGHRQRLPWVPPAGESAVVHQLQRSWVVLLSEERNRMPRSSRPGVQQQRRCHVASWGELSAGSAAATRLSALAAGMAVGGVQMQSAVEEGLALSSGEAAELSRLAWVLRQVAGRMRQVAASSTSSRDTWH